MSQLILIFSTSVDPSTTEVMRMLHKMGHLNVIRINSDLPEYNSVKLTLSDENFSLTIGDYQINLKDIRSVWYRKGSFWFSNLFDEILVDEHPVLSRSLNATLRYESSIAREFFHNIISTNVPTLNHSEAGRLNKLNVLRLARNAGLNIPNFVVTNQKESVVEFASDHDQIITKAMSDGLYLWDTQEKNTGYFSYTEVISDEEITNLERAFPLSFIQNKIEKSYEVRIFYLAGWTKSAAIFSQNSAKTAVDFRKYDTEIPNRVVPIDPPQDILFALDILFKSIGINTGSVDFVVDKFGFYYFLEINPSGQYAGIADVCNFNIDEKIANWLMNPYEI